jgi:hypothetical protein
MEARRELSAAPPNSQAPGFEAWGAARYEPPTCEIVSLDCEISAYAPDGDETPLF